MFWSASRLMSKPSVCSPAGRIPTCMRIRARSPMRLFGAVAGASADSYDAGDDNDASAMAPESDLMPVQLPTVVMRNCCVRWNVCWNVRWNAVVLRGD